MSKGKGVFIGSMTLHDVTAVHVRNNHSEGTSWQNIDIELEGGRYFSVTVFPSADARLLPETPDVVTNAIEIGDPTGVIDTAP